jgi:hypothetical protein
MKLDLFFVGDASDPHFHVVVEWLRTSARLRILATIDDAVREVKQRGACPAVVIVGQSRRGQFSQHDVERLVSGAPLARVVVIGGSWCEGELRSGNPVAGVHRLAWHGARSIVERELVALAAGRASDWSWPPVAVSAAGAASDSKQMGTGLVVVHSMSAVMAESLSMALFDAGFKTATLDPLQLRSVLGADAIVWDVSTHHHRAEAQWQTLRDQFPNVPVAALCGFPRPEDLTHWRSLGVAAVLAKPLLVADLAAAVEAVIQARQMRLSHRAGSWREQRPCQSEPRAGHWVSSD